MHPRLSAVRSFSRASSVLRMSEAPQAPLPPAAKAEAPATATEAASDATHQSSAAKPPPRPKPSPRTLETAFEEIFSGVKKTTAARENLSGAAAGTGPQLFTKLPSSIAFGSSSKPDAKPDAKPKQESAADTFDTLVDSDKMIDSIEKFEIEQWVSNFSNSATAVESFYNPKLDLDLTKFKEKRRFAVSKNVAQDFKDTPVSDVLSFNNANQKEMNKFAIQEAIRLTRAKLNDTGSTEVQVAVVSAKIDWLSEHLKKNRKDFNARRHIDFLVHQRRRLLVYLKRISIPRYFKIIDKLNLRDILQVYQTANMTVIPRRNVPQLTREEKMERQAAKDAKLAKKLNKKKKRSS